MNTSQLEQITKGLRIYEDLRARHSHLMVKRVNDGNLAYDFIEHAELALINDAKANVLTFAITEQKSMDRLRNEIAAIIGTSQWDESMDQVNLFAHLTQRKAMVELLAWLEPLA